MRKSFIHSNFILQNDEAEKLYHEYAKDLPIVDFHNHLPPNEVSDDINFRNLTHIWLDGDHYKWRALRSCGVNEELITGNASDKEKFLAWAKTVPKTLKNPLYHWTHMELNNPFGINDRLLNEQTAESIWEECNAKLQQKEFSTQHLLRKNKVELVGTTDDPTDSLAYHAAFGKQDAGFRMVPTFRPDAGMEIEKGESFRTWVAKLESVSGISITSFHDFLEALENRHSYFHSLGCRASDHGIEMPYAASFTDSQITSIFDQVMKKESISENDSYLFKSAFLYHCGLMNHAKGWVMQFHIGPIRNTNSRMFSTLGANSGFDSIGDAQIGKSLAEMLNALDSEDKLPKTVLYNSNPRDNALFSAMAGNFQDGITPGKVQHGPPWWFLDQKNGIEEQIESLSNIGVLYEFIGMTTDSRSFLSFPRHDYFRRILCNILGTELKLGLIPNEPELIASYIERICYSNAKAYFQFYE